MQVRKAETGEIANFSGYNTMIWWGNGGGEGGEGGGGEGRRVGGGGNGEASNGGGGCRTIALLVLRG